ncbi:TetR/AcrR family transcriptional regulator [Gordonia sp. HY285]|uniref:TetR/AcrR family transcriptional regulator n=1 Tax=Gordonia liuliyuniae TaxID=2911517 RepID=UPI001F171772|nr:TetR/AcrR family transcriptional regulator [Gordonia liuliyuniae]MCF8609151.1 TetR/AcrR family transcriptional regulator [Gordonia liuliyuniae]
MARWEADASGRLQRAAIELFAQQGFTETTVPQIAVRAGVTTRTFFRHFPDKREVLFAGEEGLATTFADLIDTAPSELAALGTLEHALKAAADEGFEQRRDWMRQWRAIVNAEHPLRERGLSKQQMLVTAAVKALRKRGVDPVTGELAAGMALVAFQAAAAEWVADEAATRPLSSYLEVSFSHVRQVAAADHLRM